jgi:hypothetical protein
LNTVHDRWAEQYSSRFPMLLVQSRMKWKMLVYSSHVGTVQTS